MAESIGQTLKMRYQYGGPLMKVIFWCVGIYLFFEITSVILFFIDEGVRDEFRYYWGDYLAASTDPAELLYRPWTPFTYIFLHGGFGHILGNMLVLYIGGRYLQEAVGGKRFFFVFLITGILGFFVQFLAYNTLGVYEGMSTYIVGASGCVTGVLIAIVTISPNIVLNLFGVFRLPLIVLAGFYVLMDILSLDDGDRVAHFVHLGGALFGFLYGWGYRRGTDAYMWFQRILPSSGGTPKRQKRGKFRVVKDSSRTAKAKTDDQFSTDKAARQAKIDSILDKIKDSGYDSLTKAEKEFLFRESKNI